MGAAVTANGMPPDELDLTPAESPSAIVLLRQVEARAAKLAETAGELCLLAEACRDLLARELPAMRGENALVLGKIAALERTVQGHTQQITEASRR